MQGHCRLLSIGMLLCLMCAGPAAAQVSSGAIGYIDSPSHGQTINRPPGAPHALVDFKASGMKVWIEDGTAFQFFNLQVSFTLQLGTTVLDADLPPAFLAQADANGDWSYLAKTTGNLQQLGRGVGPGNHTASILSDLVVNAGGAPNATYPHSHSFTVN